MRKKSGQEFALRVVEFYKNNNNNSALTVKHFCKELKPRRTIYNILKRFNSEGRVEYSHKRGPQPTICDDTLVRKIVKFFDKNPLATCNQAAGKFNISVTSVKKCKKLGGVVTRKRTIAPRYINDQPEKCIKAAKLLVKRTAPKHGEKIIVLDDETYVYKEPCENASVTYYTQREGIEVANEVRFKPKSKFAGKYMIWQAIGSDGQASPMYIVEGTLNAKIYEKKIIKGILLPWLRNTYDMSKVIFWPDLATSHYSSRVVAVFDSENLDYVKKDENAPNLPQARPIERYWALCKREYSKLPKQPKNINSFKRQWSRISKNVLEKSGSRLFENLRNKLICVSKHGPYGPLINKN